MGKETFRHFDNFRCPKKIEEGGVVKLSGAFLLDHSEDVLSVINHEKKQADERGGQGRITRIEKANGGIVVEVSSHKLALHLGKVLYKAYKGECTNKFLKGEKYVEVDWRRD